ncbi:helix-turn-helix transcriptional regulator [uncultured Thiothrix sp.]|uniref:helix-turn-helix domain-containing protein n=1 Tax=uncultured Thiothrix sp. TaxID=223185 RepID=UPI0026024F53|nr:helix-turn-helix transcriptional regulator [uncultured Thiothrix sp.]HMT93425.1 helix-turn-helix transcriptional regulator [Thiolinea sp.]
MEKTNFAQILKELKDRGINDYKLSELTGIERSKLTKLRNGTKQQPYYDDGAAIMQVYNEGIDNHKNAST